MAPFCIFHPEFFFSFFAFLKLMDGPFFFEAYGCPFYVMGLSTSYIFAFLKLMDGPFLIFLTQIFFLWRRGSENACKPVFWKFERQKMLEK